MTLTREATTRVAVVSVPVSDQDRAIAFYVDQLGFELLRDDSSLPGMRWVQVALPGGSTSLTLVDWFDTMPAGSMRGLVFTVANINEEYDRLTAKNVHFHGPPQTHPWATEAVFVDPDGNEFVLQQV